MKRVENWLKVINITLVYNYFKVNLDTCLTSEVLYEIYFKFSVYMGHFINI